MSAEPVGMVPPTSDDDRGPYAEVDTGIIWNKPTRDGSTTVPLTNFTARIVTEVIRDDGTEHTLNFEIESRLRGRCYRFTLPASRFSAMTWGLEELGAMAIVFPGTTIKEHARAAIQILSGTPQKRIAYTYTGWRQIEGEWVYLHGGGAIGADGNRSDIHVDLMSALQPFVLPDPPEGEDLIRAVRASLDLRHVATPNISYPLQGILYRVPLGPCDFSGHLAGGTGRFKTAFAAVFQQHFGAGFDAEHLPASWSSTGNSLEALAFYAKDAILVIDDFAPGGGVHEIARAHKEADRLFRAQGNLSGRGRLAPDGSLRLTRRPRGCTLSTGEDVPRGSSLRARIFVLSVGEGDIDRNRLTEAQRAAGSGLYAQAMAGYIRWLAPRYERLRAEMPGTIQEIRSALPAHAHRRTATIEANLRVGMSMFLDFAQDAGAITADERAAISADFGTALARAASTQVDHLNPADPTTRFLDLLRSVLASEQAHVEAREGGRPENPRAWGWRLKGQPATDPDLADWMPMGMRIGWVDGQSLYLDRDAAYRAVQSAAGQGGDALAVGADTLARRLHEKGLLASTDPDGSHLTVRVSIGRARPRVLHLRAVDVVDTDANDIPFDDADDAE